MSIAKLPPSAMRRGKPRRTRRPTLLCVDDDPDAVGAVVAALKPYDVKVLTDYTGEQGFWEAIRSKPDLIITDLYMPQGSGEMLLDCLRRNPDTRGIPVIVVSGQRRVDLSGHAVHLGAASFFQKPLPVAALIREIRRYIRLRPRGPRRTAVSNWEIPGDQ